jgi:hypothetical protein
VKEYRVKIKNKKIKGHTKILGFVCIYWNDYDYMGIRMSTIKNTRS